VLSVNKEQIKQRSLAHIEKIQSLTPIEGKDRIELARILGWNVIVKKNEFKVGDCCVYVEIDSVLPPTEEFKFLEKYKYRIKTLKMCGVYSQGICFPLSILKNGSYQEGQDVTKELKIKQYEPDMDKDPVVKRKNGFWTSLPLMKFKWYRNLVLKTPVKLPFPSEVSKTDETRIQANPNLVTYCDDRGWIATEKVDGSSGTFLLRKKGRHKFEFVVCSRNLRLEKDDSAYWVAAEKYQLKEKLIELFNTYNAKKFVCIQGEVVSSKIQNNPYKLSDGDVRVYAFNFIIDGKRMNHSDMKIVLNGKGILTVPLLGDGIDFTGKTVDEIVKMSDGKSKINSDVLREGIVYRSYTDGSFKAVSNKYLLSK